MVELTGKLRSLAGSTRDRGGKTLLPVERRRSDRALRGSRIGKAYGRRAALEGVTFSIGEGEIVGLVGPNGAGKSTTLRIVCGLLQPDTGSVWLDGSVCARPRSSTWADSVSSSNRRATGPR